MVLAISRSDSDWRFFRLLLVGWAVTCIAILLTVGAIELLADSSAETFPIVALLTVLLVLTLPYYALGRGFGERIRRVSLLVIAIDTCLLTTGEYLLGGENAIYGLPLYGILIVMAAVAHSRFAAYFIALLGAFSFAAMIAATQYDLIPRREALIVFSLSDSFAIAAVSTNFFVSLAMAIVASSLSQVKDRALDRSMQLEGELRQLNEELQRRSGQVELFARAVAHDLRNPLTAASEALRLQQDRDGTDQERLVAMSRENLLRADRMLMGLRDLMRTAGDLPELELVDVRAIVDEAVKEQRGQEGRVAVPVQVVGDLVAVQARPVQVAHVFRNLLSNALDHNRGKADLLIEVGQQTGDEGGVTTFFVRDNGRGVPPELRDRIFEPFCRGPASSETGLGLGLTLVKTIVTQAGGAVWVEEAPRGGAAFYFTLSSPGSGTNDDPRSTIRDRAV